MTTLECGHSFCTKCIEKWFCESSDIVDSCPCCRKESLNVINEKHLMRKIAKGIRGIDLPNNTHSRVYYVDKIHLYLNTKVGRRYLESDPTVKTTFLKRLAELNRELNSLTDLRFPIYWEDSRNIREAYRYWKKSVNP